MGETALKHMVGGMSKGFKTELGWRYVDNLSGDVAREAKTDFVKYSSFVIKQIEKDALLLNNKTVTKVERHFFQSPITGRVGADPRLLSMLEDKGIPYVIH